MKLTILKRTAALVTITLALGSLGMAQTPVQTRFGGMINDYTADLDGGGPWHVAGEWSVTVKGESGKADFSVALSMVRAASEPRASHTHHVWLTDGQVTVLPNGFRITGAATMTGNGNIAGFSGSQIEVLVTGGTAVLASNVSVTFGGTSAGHFGAQPLDGVVTR